MSHTGEMPITPGETPAPVTPPKIRSEIAPLPIGIEGIALDIASVRGDWFIGIYRDGTMIEEDRSSTNPVFAKGTAQRIADKIKRAAQHLDKSAVRAAVDRFFKAIKETKDGAVLVAEPVARVIDATNRVTVEMRDPPVYRVDLIDGGILVFSNREIAALQPVTLNDRWLAMHPGDPLEASLRDFEEIRKYWFSILERVEPDGARSLWESIATDLQIAIAAREPGSTTASLLDTGLYLGQGTLWISNQVVKEILRKSGKDETDPGLSHFLRQRGDLIATSKTFKVNGVVVRAWGFRPEFVPVGDSTNRPMRIDREGDQDDP